MTGLPVQVNEGEVRDAENYVRIYYTLSSHIV